MSPGGGPLGSGPPPRGRKAEDPLPRGIDLGAVLILLAREPCQTLVVAVGGTIYLVTRITPDAPAAPATATRVR